MKHQYNFLVSKIFFLYIIFFCYNIVASCDLSYYKYSMYNVSYEEREVSGGRNIPNNELTDTQDRLSIANLPLIINKR